MQTITGEQIRYIIYQEKPEVREGQNVTVPLIYNSYNGSFSEATNLLNATMFESEEEAIQMATLQNQISEILKQSFNYIVIKRVETRETIYSGKEIKDPETNEEPELPEDPKENDEGNTEE